MITRLQWLDIGWGIGGGILAAQYCSATIWAVFGPTRLAVRLPAAVLAFGISISAALLVAESRVWQPATPWLLVAPLLLLVGCVPLATARKILGEGEYASPRSEPGEPPTSNVERRSSVGSLLVIATATAAALVAATASLEMGGFEIEPTDRSLAGAIVGLAASLLISIPCLTTIVYRPFERGRVPLVVYSAIVAFVLCLASLVTASIELLVRGVLGWVIAVGGVAYFLQVLVAGGFLAQFRVPSPGRSHFPVPWPREVRPTESAEKARWGSRGFGLAVLTVLGLNFLVANLCAAGIVPEFFFVALWGLLTAEFLGLAVWAAMGPGRLPARSLVVLALFVAGVLTYALGISIGDDRLWGGWRGSFVPTLLLSPTLLIAACLPLFVVRSLGGGMRADSDADVATDDLTANSNGFSVAHLLTVTGWVAGCLAAARINFDLDPSQPAWRELVVGAVTSFVAATVCIPHVFCVLTRSRRRRWFRLFLYSMVICSGLMVITDWLIARWSPPASLRVEYLTLVGTYVAATFGILTLFLQAMVWRGYRLSRRSGPASIGAGLRESSIRT